MLQTLGEVSLASGEKMTVKLVMPPEWDYAGKVVRFLDHKPDPSRRGIRQRLRGDYAAYCTDKYFIGEIDGRIAGQLWYGYSTSGVGNFGHVYTVPEHRRKGITNVLLPFFLDDFHASPVKAVLCGTGTPWVADTYKKCGFQPIGLESGSLILLKKEWGENFEEFSKWYFPKEPGMSVVTGTMEYRHDADLMLRHALRMRGRSSQRVAMSSMVRSYEDALFRAEDGQGVLTTAVTGDGHVAGWAFGLNTGSSQEIRSKIFDYEFLPDYSPDGERRFIAESLKLMHKRGVDRMYAYLPEFDKLKIGFLEKEGFRTLARLENYLTQAEGNHAALALAASFNRPEAQSGMLCIRGEHLINLREYVIGKIRMPYPDYGLAFQKAHDAFLSRLAENPGQEVLLITDVDTLCDSRACSKRQDERCRSSKLASKDRAVAAIFGLVPDCRYTSQELVEAISRPIDNVKEIIGSIEKSLGL